MTSASRSASQVPPRARPDDHHPVEPPVALHDLVGDAGDGPPDVVGVEHLGPGMENAPSRGRRGWRALAGDVGCTRSLLLRTGLTGPVSRLSATLAGRPSSVDADDARRRLTSTRRSGRRSGPSVAGRSLGAMAESMPLTKRPESSVENRLASSTASSMTTATGTSGRSQQLVEGDAQQVAVDGRHPLERPVAGVVGDERVELGPVVLDALDELDDQRRGRHRQRRPAPPGATRPSTRPRTAAPAPARGRRSGGPPVGSSWGNAVRPG